MKDPGVNLSDLERARELSRRLTGPGTGPEPAPAGRPAPRYVEFAVPISVATPVTPPPHPGVEPAERALSPMAGPAEAPPAPPVAAAPKTFESLDVLLEHCRSELEAESAFVVDAQGFVISVGGRAAEDHFEGLGVGLSVALQELLQLDHSAGPLKWVELEFEGRRIAGVRIIIPEQGAMVLGFVAPNQSRLIRLAEVEQIASEHLPALA